MTPDSRASPRSKFRVILLAIGAFLAVALGVAQFNRLFDGGAVVPIDFAAFWAAGRLSFLGENPFDGSRLREVQAAVGLTQFTAIAWNPPWTLTFLMPFGALPFNVAYGSWVIFHGSLVVASALLLWKAYDGPRRLSWIPLVVALSYAPTTFLIGSGQLTAIVLFGLAGFAAACHAQRAELAGAAVCVTAIKPHLLLLFAVWFLVSAWRTPFGRRVLLSSLLLGTVLCVPPTLVSPAVWADYVTAVTGPADPHFFPLSVWEPPLLSWWLRQAIPGKPFWAQFVPCVLASIAVAAWGLVGRPRVTPDSVRINLPWLVGTSLLIAPYGAWAYDLVLLLVPILGLAARMAFSPPRSKTPFAVAIAGLAIINAVAFAMLVSRAGPMWYFWVTPCVLLLWLYFRSWDFKTTIQLNTK